MGTPAAPIRSAPSRKARNWLGLETTGLAVLALIVCGALGFRAHQRAAATHAEAERLRSVVTSIQQFQAVFKPITPAERRRWAAQPDSVLGIAPEERLGLTESIATLAENSGLEQPRVSFGGADTSVAPRVMAGADAAPGNYTISIEAGGGFAQLLTFVNALPVSVSVAHLDATRDGAHARFHVTLAVYENSHATHS